ncbi:MAG: YkgJ family cysteine cluster protein [Sulfolobales archaeon]
MGKKSDKFAFVNFGDICSKCNENCCKRFYAVLLPEEEEDFKDSSFEVKTACGPIKAVGSRDGYPCPYLDKSGFCSIYPKRPLDCRLWPVMVYYDFTTGERVVYLDLDCPAASAGKIPHEVIDSIISKLKEEGFDEEWLKKYTLAPWPNHLVELLRIKNER